MIYCKKCGNELPDTAKFCYKCGTNVEDVSSDNSDVIDKKTINETSVEQVSFNAKDPIKPSIKVNSKIVIPAVVIVLAILLIAVMHKPKVDLYDYFNISWNGYDTVGTAEYSYDYEKLAYVLNNPNISNKTVHISISNENTLSNGDDVTVHIEADESVIKNADGIKVVSKDHTYKVKDLSEVTVIDPFEALEVSYEGYSPVAKVIIKNKNVKPLNSIVFTSDKTDNIQNGDTITISLDLNNDEFVEKNGIVLSQLSKEYEVDGVDSYVNSVDYFTDDCLAEMQKNAIEGIESSLRGYEDCLKVDSAIYVGSIFYTPKTTESAANGNRVFNIYDATIKYSDIVGNHTQTVSYYYVLPYKNVILKNGKIEQDLSYVQNYIKYAFYNGEESPTIVEINGYASVNDFISNISSETTLLTDYVESTSLEDYSSYIKEFEEYKSNNILRNVNCFSECYYNGYYFYQESGTAYNGPFLWRVNAENVNDETLCSERIISGVVFDQGNLYYVARNPETWVVSVVGYPVDDENFQNPVYVGQEGEDISALTASNGKLIYAMDGYAIISDLFGKTEDIKVDLEALLGANIWITKAMEHCDQIEVINNKIYLVFAQGYIVYQLDLEGNNGIRFDSDRYAEISKSTDLFWTYNSNYELELCDLIGEGYVNIEQVKDDVIIYSPISKWGENSKVYSFNAQTSEKKLIYELDHLNEWSCHIADDNLFIEGNPHKIIPIE